jgi:hypothetical protein
LAFWLCLVLLLIPITRFRAAFRREVDSSEFRLGESGNVLPHVRLPNRNYMILHQRYRLLRIQFIRKALHNAIQRWKPLCAAGSCTVVSLA